MYSNTYRMVERNYGSVSDFIQAAQRNMLRIAQDGAGGHGFAMVGVWVDDSRQGVSMRVIREHELDIGQSWAWRPLKAFPLDRVASDGVNWLAQKLRGIA